MEEKQPFTYLPTASYNLIYIYTIHDVEHEGLLKIGKTSLSSPLSERELPINCDVLVEAARKRIDDETRTAKVSYELKHVELAVKHFPMADGSPRTENFTDKNVLKLLKRSHYRIVAFEDSGRESEWVEVDLKTAIRAIQSVKNGLSILPDDSSSGKIPYVAPPKKIKLRKEQEDNVVKTIGIFETYDEMLWDCKMRYGKTVTAYELIRRKEYKRVIVITHRPAVSDGWREDHRKIFGDSGHVFEDRATGSSAGYVADVDLNNCKKLHELIDSEKPFVYFASLQDLVGSICVGGKFPKNEYVFSINWELIIVDEAHEGTETDKGKAAIDGLRKVGSKLLRLSGTPYNILDKHTENVFTWTYVDEQNAKKKWAEEYPNEENPYADLPTMNILTFDLGERLKNSYRFVTEDSAFNFREFFRVWTGDANKDFRPVPSGQQAGDFVHEADVRSFLDLISHSDENSYYPFASEAFRDMFRHTFWIVPGVKEAAALSKLLDAHPIFRHFKVANVAGEGDVEQPYDKALQFVKENIANHPYTITLSCGKLTTGVTVPEWTGIMMLSGSASTSLSGYMQAIFRVQSPGCVNGKQKENCYVFDFAPDRTLKVIAGVHNITAKSNGSDGKIALGEFLNFCPIIAVEGTVMRSFDVGDMMQQIKRMSIENVIRSGFEDDLIYKSDTGIVMDEADAAILKMLSDVLTPQSRRGNNRNFVVNEHRMNREEYEQAEKIKNKPRQQQTPEDKELLDKLRKQKDEQKKVLDLLRAVSIRLPLLFYGADADITEIIRLKDFVRIVDDESWEEFMPKGLKKDFFLELLRFYDEDVLVGAGLRIRKISKAADELPPTLRANKIVQLINSFKNPDKETVLTPWRVVNMHMGDCVGGYNFYDEEYKKQIEDPRLVEQPDGSGEITADIFLNPDVKILEMNSKSGLYPLYMAYSIYKLKLDGDENAVPLEEAQRIWFETLRDNIFVLCMTEMAKLITIRTLAGYSGEKVNAIRLPHLLDRMKDKERFAKKLKNPKTWGREGEKMKFDAVVGNPPYQGNNHQQIYPYFYLSARELGQYVSLIFPSGWQEPKNGNNLSLLNNSDVKNDKRIVFIDNRQNIFPGVPGAEWTNIIFWMREYDNGLDGLQVVLTNGENANHKKLPFNPSDVEKPSQIIDLASIVARNSRFVSMQTITSQRKPYGLSTDVIENYQQYRLPPLFDSKHNVDDVKVYAKNNTEVWVPSYYPFPKVSPSFKKYKVFIPYAWGNMSESAGLGGAFSNIVIGFPSEACTETYLESGCFDTFEVAQKHAKYLMTKFVRALLYVNKHSQHSTRAWGAIPAQDYSESWWDGSVNEINVRLMDKYSIPQNIIDFVETNIQERSESNIVNFVDVR